MFRNGYSQKSKNVELFPRMRRGFGCPGSHETGYSIGSLLVNAFLETTSIGLIGIMLLLETKKISQDRQHLILIIDAPYLM